MDPQEQIPRANLLSPVDQGELLHAVWYTPSTEWLQHTDRREAPLRLFSLRLRLCRQCPQYRQGGNDRHRLGYRQVWEACTPPRCRLRPCTDGYPTGQWMDRRELHRVRWHPRPPPPQGRYSNQIITHTATYDKENPLGKPCPRRQLRLV